MITVIPRILSMAQPMATSFPVTGMELISSTEFFLDSFRPSPQGTIWFPQMCATRINEKKGLIQPSGTKLLLTHDNVSELEFTKTLMFLDAGRILIEKGYRLLKATLQDHPLAATVHRPWSISTSHLDEEFNFSAETEVTFDDGYPAREVPSRFELEEKPSAHRNGQPLKRIAVEISTKDSKGNDDSIQVSEFHRGAERSVTVFHSQTEGLQTFYDFRWAGGAVKGLKGLLRLPEITLPELGRELAALIGASGLYEDRERKYLIAGIAGGDFWIRPEQDDKPSAFSVEGHVEENDDTLIVHLSPSEKNFDGGPMPLPPSLFNILWKGIFDFTD